MSDLPPRPSPASPVSRDVLVVLREELVAARPLLDEADVIWKMDPTAPAIADAAQKLRGAITALDARIHSVFDTLLLNRAAATFRAAVKALQATLTQRHASRCAAPDVKRVVKRLVAHAREIGRITHQVGADHVGAAIEQLALPESWESGPLLDAVVHLVDTLLYLSRQKLGDKAGQDQLGSLIDRAASTAMVTSLHALKDLARRAQSEPTVMRDRYQLENALKASSSAIVERLSGWLSLDAAGHDRLQQAVELFARRMLDRAAKQ